MERKNHRKNCMLQLLQEQDIQREKGSVLPMQNLLIKGDYSQGCSLKGSNQEDEDDNDNSEMIPQTDPSNHSRFHHDV